MQIYFSLWDNILLYIISLLGPAATSMRRNVLPWPTNIDSCVYLMCDIFGGVAQLDAQLLCKTCIFYYQMTSPSQKYIIFSTYLRTAVVLAEAPSGHLPIGIAFASQKQYLHTKVPIFPCNTVICTIIAYNTLYTTYLELYHISVDISHFGIDFTHKCRYLQCKSQVTVRFHLISGFYGLSLIITHFLCKAVYFLSLQGK